MAGGMFESNLAYKRAQTLCCSEICNRMPQKCLITQAPSHLEASATLKFSRLSSRSSAHTWKQVRLEASIPLDVFVAATKIWIRLHDRIHATVCRLDRAFVLDVETSPSQAVRTIGFLARRVMAHGEDEMARRKPHDRVLLVVHQPETLVLPGSIGKERREALVRHGPLELLPERHTL